MITFLLHKRQTVSTVLDGCGLSLHTFHDHLFSSFKQRNRLYCWRLCEWWEVRLHFPNCSGCTTFFTLSPFDSRFWNWKSNNCCKIINLSWFNLQNCSDEHVPMKTQADYLYKSFKATSLLEKILSSLLGNVGRSIITQGNNRVNSVRKATNLKKSKVRTNEINAQQLLRWFIFPHHRAASAPSEKWPPEQNWT